MNSRIRSNIFHLVVFIELMVVTSQAQGLNTLSVAEQKAGFILQYDGKAIDDAILGANPTTKSNWKVVDSAISPTSFGPDICTQARYKDFEMRIDVRLADVDENSGFFTRAPKMENNAWSSGAPEFALQGEPDICGYQCHTGDDYAQKYASSYPFITGTPYNSMVLFFNGPLVEFWVNSIKVNEFEMYTPAWLADKAVSSRWSNDANYGKSKEGHICIQDHTGPQSNNSFFRNWKIRSFVKNGVADTQVPEPVILVTDTSAQSVKVTLDVGMTGAQLRYTLDGSTPTANSPLFTVPLTINPGVEVKVQAYRANFTPSIIASRKLGGTAGALFQEGKNKIAFDGLTFSVLEQGAHSISIRDIQGNLLLEKRGIGRQNYLLKDMRGLRGVKVVSIRTPSSRWQQMVFID